MSYRKEKFISDNMIGFILGFTFLVGIYIWKYHSMSAGWQFLGMIFISMIVSVAVQLFIMTISGWRAEKLEKKRISDMCRTIGITEDYSETKDVLKYWRYCIARYLP